MDPLAKTRAAVSEAYRSVNGQQQRQDYQRKSFDDFLREAKAALDLQEDKINHTANKLEAALERVKTQPPSQGLIADEDNVFSGLLE